MKLICNIKRSESLRKVFYYSMIVLLFIYTFCVPSFGESTSFLRYSIYISMILLGVVTFAYSFYFDDFRINKALLIVPAFVAFAFLGTAISSKQFREWFTLVLLMISFFIFYFSFKNVKNKHLVVAIISAAFFAFSLYYIFHYRHEIIDFRSYTNSDFRLGSYFDNPNGVSAYAVVGLTLPLYLLLFWNKKIRFLFIAPILTSLIVGLSTGSRTFLLMIVIVAIVLLYFKFKKHKWIFLIVLSTLIVLGIVAFFLPFMDTLRNRIVVAFETIFGIADKADTATIERTIWMDYGFYLGAKQLIFGYGVDGFAIFSGVGTYSHSNFSEVICDFGLPGFVLFYSPLVILLVKGIINKKVEKSFVITFFVYYFIVSFSNVLYYKKIYYLVLAFLYYFVFVDGVTAKKVSVISKIENIVFTCDSMGSGGAEKVISLLANEMVTRGINVTIVGVSDRSNNGSFYQLNPSVRYVTLNNGGKKTNSIKRVYLLRKTIKDINPDVVISFLPHINVYTYASLIATKIPYIVSERNNPYIDPKEKVLRILKKLSFTKADGCVFQTQDAMDYYSDKIKEKSVIIQNPLDMKFVPPQTFIRRNNVVLAVGRITEQKNYRLLIDAFKEFNEKKNLSYILKIYGDGPLKEELISYCENQGILSQVVFVGKDNNWQEKEYMDAMYILTSDYEGMPNALTEAMALGIPCISTDCPSGGPKQLIQDGENGFLVEVNNKEKLVEKMLLISNSPTIFQDKNETMINNLKTDRILDNWISYMVNLQKEVYE